MSSPKIFEVVVIGGGIVGTSTALNLLKIKNISLLLLEAEDKLSAHQTGNNSGVIHSGIYYKPGSLKALNCTAGRVMMYEFCEQQGIKYERCGKIIVAVNKNEISMLNDLERKGNANGLKGLRRLSAGEVKEREPNVSCVDALFVPETGIVDYVRVTEEYAKIILNSGGEIRKNCRFISLSKDGNDLVLQTTGGEVRAKFLVNCAGLHSDRVAKLCNVDPKLQIFPFRGEYYKLKKESEHLVNNLIYPVPDPKFPFLGVHFTRMINGGIEAGPNAVLAFKREGYSKKDFSITDVADMLIYKGFWRMAFKHYKMGIGEYYRSYNKQAFVKALQKLVPSIGSNDIYPEGSGVRAQALERDGKLVDDFRIVEADKMIHILNAPSPAATASLSIGKTLAQKIIPRLIQ
ncbi:MAG: L-2-hydroxyglutarate oxidase [Ignavibacteriaceae bacterium]|jgi:L-2-hydroxyglutarate oxidase